MADDYETSVQAALSQTHPVIRGAKYDRAGVKRFVVSRISAVRF